jgi:DNA mismatch repair protein MutL
LRSLQPVQREASSGPTGALRGTQDTPSLERRQAADDSSFRLSPAEMNQPAAPGQFPAANVQLPPLRVIGQIGAMYVIAEGPDGMYLIDQHAAHERILYEKFMADKAALHITVQHLLDPVPVEVSPAESVLLEEHREVLSAIGLGVEAFGGSTWLVRSIPALLINDDIRVALSELIADLLAGDLPFAANEEAKLITRVCKRAAIKGGQVLSMPEMNELIRQLELCVSPRTCPHGRPTMIHFSASQMAREFGRI